MIIVTRCTASDDAGWLRLREALWPQCGREEHLDEMSEWIAHPGTRATYLANTERGLVVGFVEAAIRCEPVNGTETSPVGFIEGLYVHPDHRRQGAARKLVRAVEKWTLECGCRELASDADLANEAGQDAHRALGFEETERVVYFRKPLE